MPPVSDLAFPNPLLLAIVKGWDTSLPSTGSTHIPITIPVTSPSPDLAPPDLTWDYTDWETLSPLLKNFRVSAPPACPSLNALEDWITGWLDQLTGLLKEHTPSSRPDHQSNPWSSLYLTILRREYHKAARTAQQEVTMAQRELANISRAGYFTAIMVAKNKYLSSFLLTATP